jgi:serine/threonine-protein kinase
VVTARAVTPPSKWAPELSGDLEVILLKALRKDPQERYTTVDQFADDLRRYLHNEPVTARPDSLVYRTRKFVRRHRSGLAAAATAVLALIAGSGIAVRQARVSAHERDFALTELRRAEATNDFSSLLLAEATPSAGKPISNADLLARGEALIPKLYAGDAALRMHMLLTLANRYQENLQYADRARVLQQAYAESQSIGDVGLRAEAACQWASQLAERGDFTQSFQLVDAALALLSARSEYAAIESGCRVIESIGASQAQDAARAIRAAERALALEEQRGGAPGREIQPLDALGGAYRMAHRYTDADRVFERLVNVFVVQGREDTRDMAAVLNNWSVMLGEAGQKLRAASVAERAMRIARSLDSEHGASVPLLSNLAADLAASGRYAEANPLFDEAIAKGQALGSPRRYILTLALAIESACTGGDAKRGERLLSEADATLKADASATEYSKGLVEMGAAQVALAGGDRERAVELARQAIATLDRATPTKATAGAARGVLVRALTETNRFSEALPIAEQRLTTARGALGGFTHSYQMGIALLAVASAKAGLGDRDDARELNAEAIEHLSATVGTDSRVLQRALALNRQLAGL